MIWSVIKSLYKFHSFIQLKFLQEYYYRMFPKRYLQSCAIVMNNVFEILRRKSKLSLPVNLIDLFRTFTLLDKFSDNRGAIFNVSDDEFIYGFWVQKILDVHLFRGKVLKGAPKK